MLTTLRGITLHSIAYNDRNDIVYLYTRQRGLVGALVAKSKSKRSKRNNLLSSPPLEVELIGDVNKKNSLVRISQFSIVNAYNSIRLDPIKATIMMFLSELLYRILREPEPDNQMYDFICQSFQFLDETEDSSANFHLCFLYYLLMHLGFSPDFDCSDNRQFFDMTESCFTNVMPNGPYISPREATFLPTFQRINYHNMHLYRFTRQERQIALKYLITYYRLHLPPFGELKTLEVLKEMFG
ncbi:DNA repair protein RecO [Falsiporphyromonas endometrii]|uniref:DNA repair protein RecO n=1 Tax=Falsiporphyromonas endometrii TaxID=1387297 RepID=A0ABV9K8H8_9PORP